MDKLYQFTEEDAWGTTRYLGLYETDDPEAVLQEVSEQKEIPANLISYHETHGREFGVSVVIDLEEVPLYFNADFLSFTIGEDGEAVLVIDDLEMETANIAHVKDREGKFMWSEYSWRNE